MSGQIGEAQQRNDVTALTPRKREEIVRRYWMKGDLTPLAVANSLAGQQVPAAA